MTREAVAPTREWADPHVANRPSLTARAAAPLTVVVLSLLAAAQALRLWDWRPGVPLSLSGDAPFVLVQVRAALEGGSAVSPHLGAPFGLNHAWFANGNALSHGELRLLGLVSDSPATVAVLFFLLTFPLAGLTAYWLAVQVGIARLAAVVVGVLFAVIPGHQEWFHHLWLAAYWPVPLALWLVLQVARGRPLWPPLSSLRGGTGAVRRPAWTAMARTAGILVAVGLSDVYYVAFTLILLAAALAFRVLVGDRPSALGQGAGALAAIGALCGASLLIATRARAGDLVTGALPAQRVIGESEVYAGKLIDLVLPWHDHRAAPLEFLTDAYAIAAPASVERPALGVVALTGLVALLAVTLRGLLGGERPPRRAGLLAAFALVCLAFYTRGGLGSLVALFLTPQIRTWSRLVVFLALIGLLGAGLLLTHLRRRRGPVTAGVLAALVLAVGVLDQTNPAAGPDHRALARESTALTAFTTELADAVGGRPCQVLQLPVVAFPEEPPPGRMGDYDHLLPAVVSPASLSWSHGAIRGTSRGDWQLALPVAQTGRLLEDAAAAGFCAVAVDRDGYAAGTDPSAAIEAVLGAAVARSADAGLAAYDLRALRARLAADRGEEWAEARRPAVLRPVVASMDGSLVEVSGGVPAQHTGPSSTVTIGNMGDVTVPVTLALTLAGVGPDERTVTIETPDGQRREVLLGPGAEQRVTLPLDADPGRTLVRVRTSGPVSTVPGTRGAQSAALTVSSMTLTTQAPVNVAALQQFAAASPASER